MLASIGIDLGIYRVDVHLGWALNAIQYAVEDHNLEVLQANVANVMLASSVSDMIYQHAPVVDLVA